MFCYDLVQAKSHRKTANVLFLNAFEIIADTVDNW